MDTTLRTWANYYLVSLIDLIKSESKIDWAEMVIKERIGNGIYPSEWTREKTLEYIRKFEAKSIDHSISSLKTYLLEKFISSSIAVFDRELNRWGEELEYYYSGAQFAPLCGSGYIQYGKTHTLTGSQPLKQLKLSWRKSAIISLLCHGQCYEPVNYNE